MRERQRPRVRVGASETENVETLGVVGGGSIIVRKVTGRSRTAMRGEAALTVRRGCVGLGGARERGTWLVGGSEWVSKERSGRAGLARDRSEQTE